MITVNVTYDADIRMMSIDSISSGGNAVATTGDDQSTCLRFSFHDTQGVLDGFLARVEFGVNVTDEDGNTYRPLLELDSNDSVILPNSILSAVKCGLLPFQIAFVKRDSNDKKIEFYSLNILNLAVNKALDALHSPHERDPKFGDVLYNVDYNSTTATFTFTHVDGTVTTIALTDLAEDHFEVDTYEELTTLSSAETGDTATVLETGVWYKLYGQYDILDNWYQMAGGVTINGTETANPVFYAPIESGLNNQMLISRGENQPPVWKTVSRSFYINFASTDAVNVPLYNSRSLTKFIDCEGTNITCVFSNNSTKERLILPYKVKVDMTVDDIPYYSVDVTCTIPVQVRMDVYSIPSLGGVY